MYYRRLTEGLNDKGKLIPETSDVFDYIKSPEKDYYLSTFKYTEEQKSSFLESGTVAGVTDVVTDKLWWDFDSEYEPEEARKSAVKLVERLLSEGFNKEDIVITFSGNKGFGIELNVHGLLNPKDVKGIALNLAGNLAHFDVKMYNASRILRVFGTKHQKTKLFKIPLTFHELTTLSVDNIIEKAKRIPQFNEEFRWERVQLPPSLLKRNNPPEMKQTEDLFHNDSLDYTMKPKFLSNCRWAIQNGFFEEGDRSTALLCLGSTYKNLGFDLEHVYRLLKGTAELQARINRTERFSDEEIYNNIVLQVFGPNWNNGQYTCREEGNWLKTFCDNLEHPCNHKQEDEMKPKTFLDLKDDFKNYVKNIEKNTIHIGLPSIDKNVFLSTGANVGIIGAAGCHSKGTKILMYDGSVKNVEDIKVEELLMGPDSKPRKVLELRRGREKMVKIKPFRSDEFIVNLSHILHLSPSYLKTKSVIPGNLNITVNNFLKGTSTKKRSLLNGYKLIKTGVEFNEKELELPPYILGLWLGDGSSGRPALTTMDEEILIEWSNYSSKLNMKLLITEQINNKSKTYTMSSGRKIKNKFRTFLCENNLLNNKHIPTNYLINSRNNRLQLLAGLIDTDGYCEANKRGWEISQKNEKLANQIVFLARSLGFHSSIHKRRKSCSSKGLKIFGDYYIIYISGQNCNEVPVRLSRKKVLTKTLINPLHQGFKTEVLEEDDFYGFTLDKDHLYLTEDFFIHHNSGKTAIALEILNNTSKAGVKSVCASLDMAKNRIFEKVLYRLTGYERNELYKIFQDDKEQPLMDKLKEEFGNVNFFKKSSPTVQDIREYIIKCNEQSDEKIKLVVIDYFERVNSDMGDDTAASKKVAGELQDLVDDLDICLITLVQPNKFALSDGPDKPIYDYTKIKGSSFVYQAFRIILSAWRPFYNPKDFNNDKYIQMSILKNDLGELNEFVFSWDGKRGKISEMEDYQKEEFEELLKNKNESSTKKDNWV